MSNKVTVTYQDTPIINEKEIEGNCEVIYKGSVVQTIGPNNEITLNTKDKYTSDFITIAGEKLNTANKIIKDYIHVKVEIGNPPLNAERVFEFLYLIPLHDYVGNYNIYNDTELVGYLDTNYEYHSSNEVE